jgi:hypothetical protein
VFADVVSSVSPGQTPVTTVPTVSSTAGIAVTTAVVTSVVPTVGVSTSPSVPSSSISVATTKAAPSSTVVRGSGRGPDPYVITDGAKVDAPVVPADRANRGVSAPFAKPAPPAEKLVEAGGELSAKAGTGTGRVVMRNAADRRGSVAVEENGNAIGLRPIRPKSTADVVPVVAADGLSTRWPAVFDDGSDLVERVSGQGAKGAVVLSKPPTGNAEWDFELSLSTGLVPAQVSDGTITIKDSTGKVVAILPRGIATDAAGAKSNVVSVRNLSRGLRPVGLLSGFDECFFAWVVDPGLGW